MRYPELKEHFAAQVFPTHPNEWEFEDVLLGLESLSEKKQLILLKTVSAVWPISQSLCHSVLSEGVRLAKNINEHNSAEWLRQILFHYETGGLISARMFMADSDSFLTAERQQESRVLFQQLTARLSSYAKGMGGETINLQVSSKIYTDTETIFVPDQVNFFPKANDNLLYFKFIIALQSSFIRNNTLGRHLYSSRPTASAGETEDEMQQTTVLDRFQDQSLATDIYQLVETGRALSFLRNEYPGLMRTARPLITKLLQLRPETKHSQHRLLEKILAAFFLDLTCPSDEMGTPLPFKRAPNTFEQSQRSMEVLYNHIEQNCTIYEPFSFFPFMERFNLEESRTTIDKRIEREKKKFESRFAALLNTQEHPPKNTKQTSITPESIDSVTIQLNNIHSEQRGKKRIEPLVLNNNSIELPEDLIALIKTIKNDQGEVPESYISAAFGLSGGGISKTEIAPDSNDNDSVEFLPYDEWDFRRQGYRKNWCSLRERELMGVQSDFIMHTLQKYNGPLKKIKRQFEMMYTQERFARRRKSGDDIDLDALIDSLGDQYAGLPASENLFIQLIRDQRSISTLFLVDMSNSTEGWVGLAIKEALVLLCEALEKAGDEYGIYGFSGMRRMRSEVYRIKDLTEQYSAQVKERLAAIGPKDYTRMGPPIRHMIKRFNKVDSKTRLMIILSDGKPEDYDDYKGQYAIEDTRKALAEAKGQGILPYCITIDKQAHDYLEHLFGRGNYAFVRKIETLPSKLTEIYRLLTR